MSASFSFPRAIMRLILLSCAMIGLVATGGPVSAQSNPAAASATRIAQAEVEVRAGGDKLAFLRSRGDDLRLVLITSAAKVVEAAAGAADAVVVTPSSHAKCERCWHWRADVSKDGAYLGLCGRCVSNLHGSGEARVYA